jgi:hypothetical protein
MLDGVGTRYIAGRRCGESEQVGTGEEVKQGSEGSLKRELYRLYCGKLDSYSTVDRNIYPRLW